MPFIDEVFPADSSSLVYDPLVDQLPDFAREVVTWKRPRQLCSAPQLFVDSAQPGDVVQGALGDCWLLSAFSVVALYPDLLKKLFVECDEKNGRYVVRLYTNNQWNDIVIDDRIPCNSSGTPAYGKNSLKNEMWVVILEKAVAKLLGGYEALHGGYLEEGVAYLTGGRPERIYVNNVKKKVGAQVWRKDKLWEKLVRYNGSNVLMGSSISNGREEADQKSGLVAGHAYGIVDVRETQDKKFKMIKLRNPWGQFEWKGNWSDNSRKWTTAYRKELGQESKDDGVFWMQYEDFCTYFDKITCCRLFNDSIMGLKHDSSIILDGGEKLFFPDAKYYRQKIVGQWTGDNAGGMATKMGFATNPHLKLVVKKPSRVFLMITRPPLSMDADAQYYRTGIGFTVHQGINSDYKSIPSENSPNSVLQYPVYGRYNSLELDLDPETYVITPVTLFPNRRSDYVFEAYSDCDFELSPLDNKDTTKQVPSSARNSRAAIRHETVVQQQMARPMISSFNKTQPPTQSRATTNPSTQNVRKTSQFTTTYQFEFGGRKL